MRFLLEAHDFDVQTYQTGEDFFQADPRTACLIVDYHMPGLDGLELVSAMRRRSRCISEIIMITATSDPCIERRASELGIRRVFRKPLSDDVLLTAVRVSLRTG